MSLFIGADGYGRFVLGWVDDKESNIYANLNTNAVRELRSQIRNVLRERDVEDDLRMARAERDSLLRSNAALRGALKRVKKGRRK